MGSARYAQAYASAAILALVRAPWNHGFMRSVFGRFTFFRLRCYVALLAWSVPSLRT